MSRKKDSNRWIVTWSNFYDDTIENASEAVVVALGDLEDAIKNCGLGTNLFKVEDVETGTVTIISSEVALEDYNRFNPMINLINVDNSINDNSVTSIVIDGIDKTKGKKK